jgi:uncharacterized protein YbjT (DUF2867 family)
MTRMPPVATVFGGTGFIGRRIVRALARAGAQVRVASRVPERAYALRPCGVPGQIVPVACDGGPEAIARVLAGSDWVVNTVGQLFEKKARPFERAHVDIPRAIAQACAGCGVGRFVHISALGVEHSRARYALTKQAGEEAIRAAFPAATILRPSVVFGPDDNFFNQFASLARIAPALPLIGGGKTRFQPVFVDDVAAAALNALTWPALPPENPQGKTYELGGPEVFTFREILERIALWTGRARPLVSVPWGLARLQAAMAEWLPVPPLTRDQVELLRTDSVTAPGAAGLKDLGVIPTTVESVVPFYLERYREGGPFGVREAA